MQLNNVSPAPPKTLADLSVGDCFVFTKKTPEKVFILFSKSSNEDPNSYGIIELAAEGVSIYNPPVIPFSLQDTIAQVEIHSIDFSEK